MQSTGLHVSRDHPHKYYEAKHTNHGNKDKRKEPSIQIHARTQARIHTWCNGLNPTLYVHIRFVFFFTLHI
jgi:hypothetical protein